MRVSLAAAIVMAGLLAASTAIAADMELGKKIYGEKCASCHGVDGKGNAKMAEKLKVKIGDISQSPKSEAEMIQLVSDGKPPMPSFKRLSKEDLEAVVQYARSLKQGAK